VPNANDPFAGVIANDTNAGAPTVSVADPLIVPEAAVIVPLPTAVALARPVALMTAALLEELHVTDPVKSCVEPSVYFPLAANCCVVPSGMDAAVGVTVSETSDGGPTVNKDDAEMEPELAVMVAVPIAFALASPALVTLATLLEEPHVTEPVRSCVPPLVYVPTASNC
jgi:hypothetical protein